MKEKALEIINELRDDIQSMREEGDTDLRTVLHRIGTAYNEIKKLD